MAQTPLSIPSPPSWPLEGGLLDETLATRSTGAVISEDRMYRYFLTRAWATEGQTVPPSLQTTALWLMLNPSIADAQQDDPTIRRCTAFSRAHGCDSLAVMNLYAWRATDPRQLRDLPADVRVGPENDDRLRRAAQAAAARNSPVIAAWGAGAALDVERARHVTEMFRQAGNDVLCLGTTRAEHPRHPLYVSGITKLRPYTPYWEGA